MPAISKQVQDSDEAVAFTPLTFERISISRDHLERVVILSVVKWKSIVLSFLIQIYAY